jgi:uncharacterized protein
MNEHWQLIRLGPITTVGDGVLPRSGYEVVFEETIYLLPSNLQEGFVLYDPIGSQVLDISNEQAALLIARKEDPVALRKFLKALLGGRDFKCKVSKMSSTYKPTSVALMLTSSCQLRCSYCYAEAGNTPAKHLPISTARSGVSIVANNAVSSTQKKFSVHLHGAGEPTLRPTVISEILEYISYIAVQLRVDSYVLMSTNFCLEPKDAVRYAKELNCIFVSCDGTPDVSDVNRPMATKRRSSGEVLEAALKAVQDAGLSEKLVVRCTVTRDTQTRLCEFTKYFAKLGIKNIYFVPVSALGRGNQTAAVDPAHYVEEFRRASKLAKEIGICISHPGTDITQLRSDGYGCGIRGSNFVILPDGDVSLCYEAVLPNSPLRKFFNIGAMRGTTLDVDDQRVKFIAETTHVKNRSTCSTCFCRLTCAGQCAARNIVPTENPRDAPMSDACDITRALTRDAIDQLLEE